MPRIAYSAMLVLARKASLSGATRRNTTSLEWDIAGDCEKPVVVECWGRQSPDDPELTRRKNRKARSEFAGREAAKLLDGDHSWEPPPAPDLHGGKSVIVGTVGGARPPLVVTMHTRCRRCAKCRKVRSRMWYARAVTETLQSSRTWFGTITLHPDACHQTLARARQQTFRRGLIWEEMTPQEQFTELHKQNGLHLQLWLKRVRKESGARLRFLLVCEAHKSGLPHYHCLIHEQWGSAPVRHRVLADQWKLGFTNFKLVTDAKQAGYLCKYLSKSALARVRASARYGKTLCSDSDNVTAQRDPKVSAAPMTHLGCSREPQASASARTPEDGINEEI